MRSSDAGSARFGVCGGAEAGDDGVVAAVAAVVLGFGVGEVFDGGVVDEEVAAAFIVGREGDAEQSTFATVGVDAVADVEEGIRQRLPVLDDANEPALFDDEQASAAVASVAEMHGIVVRAGHRLQGNRRPAGRPDMRSADLLHGIGRVAM